MGAPRNYKDSQRIIRRANYASAEADLNEYDRLLLERFEFDPSIKLTAAQKKAKTAKEQRMKVLGRKLTKTGR